MLKFVLKSIRDVLLLAHRQVFAWADDWFDLSYEAILDYERKTYEKTNLKVIPDKDNLFLYSEID
jgi:hypothetical protein